MPNFVVRIPQKYPVLETELKDGVYCVVELDRCETGQAGLKKSEEVDQ